MTLDGSKLSEVERHIHPRQFRTEHSDRTGNGTLKYDLVSVKHVFKISWEMLPEDDADVPDGGLGMRSLETISEDGTTHTLRVYKESGSPNYDDYTVIMTGFDPSDIVERDAAAWWWKVSIVLEEQ
jgi:hypothetical protein